MFKTLFATLSIAASLAADPALAQAVPQQATPVGVWKTVDDKTGKPKSLVRIVDAGGELRGTVEKLFRDPAEDQNPKCEKCSGELKDKPVLGMTILTGMKREADGSYGGGHVLDPANGKTYKAKVELEEQGHKLKVRGYVGVPLLGRTQTWLREE